VGAGSHLGTPGGPTQHETNRTARCQPEKFPPLYKKEMSCSPNPNCYTPPPPKSPIPLPLTSPSDSTLSLSLSLSFSLSPPATPKERQTTRRSRSPPPPVCSPGRLSGPPFRRRRYSPPLRYPLCCAAPVRYPLCAGSDAWGQAKPELRACDLWRDGGGMGRPRAATSIQIQKSGAGFRLPAGTCWAAVLFWAAQHKKNSSWARA
jgi:hypothetical protein